MKKLKLILLIVLSLNFTINAQKQKDYIKAAKNEKLSLEERIEAVKKIDDQEEICKILKNKENYRIIQNEYSFFVEAINKINKELLLKDIIENANITRVKTIAIRKINDQSYLFSLVLNSEDYEIRIAATETLKDQEKLIYLSLHSSSISVQNAAIKKINDQQTLYKLAKEYNFSSIRVSAIERLDSIQWQDFFNEIVVSYQKSDEKVSEKVCIAAIKKLDPKKWNDLLLDISYDETKSWEIREVAREKLLRGEVKGKIVFSFPPKSSLTIGSIGIFLGEIDSMLFEPDNLEYLNNIYRVDETYLNVGDFTFTNVPITKFLICIEVWQRHFGGQQSSFYVPTVGLNNPTIYQLTMDNPTLDIGTVIVEIPF